MRISTTFTAILFSCALFACTTDDGSDSSTTVAGASRYRDADTNSDGSAREAAAPPAQRADVEVIVRGTATIPEVDPQCALDPAGEFQALFGGDASFDEDGAYLGSVGAGSVRIETPSGCEIPELEVGVITDVVIRAELEATTQNCETYCQASARSTAEAECGAEASAAECRGQAEADAAASCITTCSTRTDVIVAEISLGASALGELDADALRAAALGELHAELTFDHMEDSGGEILDP